MALKSVSTSSIHLLYLFYTNDCFYKNHSCHSFDMETIATKVDLAPFTIMGAISIKRCNTLQKIMMEIRISKVVFSDTINHKRSELVRIWGSKHLPANARQLLILFSNFFEFKNHALKIALHVVGPNGFNIDTPGQCIY